MKINIRPAKPKDWKIIQELQQEVFEDNYQYDKFLNKKWLFTQEGIDYCQAAVSEKNYCCLIAEVNNKPAAYLIGSERNHSYRTDRNGEIETMGSSPTFRSQGIGSLLITKFKQWCKEKGISYISANTYAQSPKLINFYQKNGLQPMDLILKGKI